MPRRVGAVLCCAVLLRTYCGAPHKIRYHNTSVCLPRARSTLGERALCVARGVRYAREPLHGGTPMLATAGSVGDDADVMLYSYIYNRHTSMLYIFLRSQRTLASALAAITNCAAREGERETEESHVREFCTCTRFASINARSLAPRVMMTKYMVA